MCILTFVSDFPTVYQLDLICQVPKCSSQFKGDVHRPVKPLHICHAAAINFNILLGFYVSVIYHHQSNE